MGSENSVPEAKPSIVHDDENNSFKLLGKIQEESQILNCAARSVVDDVTEVTCIICQEEFDLALRLPKMLEFCHHTFCLSCLKVIV